MSSWQTKDNEPIVTEYTPTSPSYQVWSVSYIEDFNEPSLLSTTPTTPPHSPLSPQSPYSPKLSDNIKLKHTIAKRAIAKRHWKAEQDDTDVIESRKVNPTLYKPRQ